VEIEIKLKILDGRRLYVMVNLVIQEDVDGKIRCDLPRSRKTGET